MTTLANALATVRLNPNLEPQEPGVLDPGHPFDPTKLNMTRQFQPVDQVGFFHAHPGCELRGPTYLTYPVEGGVVNIKASGEVFFYNYENPVDMHRDVKWLMAELVPYYIDKDHQPTDVDGNKQNLHHFGPPVDQAAFFSKHSGCEWYGPKYLTYEVNDGKVNINASGLLFFYNFPTKEGVEVALKSLMEEIPAYYTVNPKPVNVSVHPPIVTKRVLVETKDTVQPPTPKKKKLTRQRQYEVNLYHTASVISTNLECGPNPDGSDIQAWACTAMATAAWLRKEHGDVIPGEALQAAIDRARKLRSFHKRMSF